ncbi:MAG: hypothetical protein GX627_00720 [Parcubacteria group bacterium]|mgnify:CR=1 FL=1|jgi:hypothetical protein|nr:hypothetical protein [Parcubacteria group bacterium]
MLNKIYKIGFIFLVILIPSFAFAQFSVSSKILFALRNMITQTIIPIVFSLALLMFFWGMVKYIKDEGQGKAEGRKLMMWGVIALFVMSTIWGLVAFVRSELEIPEKTQGVIPTIKIN